MCYCVCFIFVHAEFVRIKLMMMMISGLSANIASKMGFHCRQEMLITCMCVNPTG